MRVQICGLGRHTPGRSVSPHRVRNAKSQNSPALHAFRPLLPQVAPDLAKDGPAKAVSMNATAADAIDDRQRAMCITP